MRERKWTREMNSWSRERSRWKRERSSWTREISRWVRAMETERWGERSKNAGWCSKEIKSCCH